MRVIAGAAKGTRLAAPEGLATRPVPDRVKESWFAVLGRAVEGARVLDLYCGSGSLGIEALSRGAESCVFVEREGAALHLLARHLELSRLAERSETLAADAAVALEGLARGNERFDLVFVDPPFEASSKARFYSAEGVLARAGGLLAAEGVMMVRREAGCAPRPGPPEGLGLLKKRAWGRSEVLFLRSAPGRPSASAQAGEAT
jgi:16S rRNA (guanine966-N2)-methyltransferase